MRKGSQAFIDYLSSFGARLSELVSNLVARDALVAGYPADVHQTGAVALSDGAEIEESRL